MSVEQNKRQIESSAGELNDLFKPREGDQIAGDVLGDVLWTPGVVIKLFKHGARAAELRVRQNGVLCPPGSSLKNWVISGAPGARKTDAPASINANDRPCTITIDPRDIEDARWAGSSKSSFGFIVNATVLDDEGVHRGATKILATADPALIGAARAGKLDTQAQDSKASP